MDKSLIYAGIIVAVICSFIFGTVMLILFGDNINVERHYAKNFIDACKEHGYALESDSIGGDLRYEVQSGLKGVDFDFYALDEPNGGAISLYVMEKKSEASEEASYTYDEIFVANKNGECSELKETKDGKSFNVTYVQGDKYNYVAYKGHAIFTATCNVNNTDAVKAINELVEEIGYKITK